MNYRAILKIILFSIVMLALSSCGEKPKDDRKMLNATILKIGKADAIVLIQNGHCMLIDAGEDDDGDEIIGFLKKNSINSIDTMIITHFDKDHVGGADRIVKSIKTADVLIPDYESDNPEYLSFVETLEKNGIVPKRLNSRLEFIFAECKVTVDPPKDYTVVDASKEYDNDFSLITTVQNGNDRLLFMGDAEKKRIGEWLESEDALKCDFIKMPHHGKYNKALSELINRTLPKNAAICSSNKNPAETKTLDMLKSFGVKTFETRNGNITVSSSGNSVEMHQNGR